MSAKKATIITIMTLLTFILITVGIGSVGADGKHMIARDGYGISSETQYEKAYL
ncbi:hypothetical protein ABID23_000388 [Bartonella silvatica]|uniref:Uncharacterized protein n=1 Tax=Bartonella silvatica TaxID=357760 RepID=A0ABV2HFJ2_9HYPH